MSTDPKQHSSLSDETYYALVNAVTSRFETIGDSRKVVDQDGLRREYERILFEQLEATQTALRQVIDRAENGPSAQRLYHIRQIARDALSNPAKRPR